jgi:enterochelin esterase family protein
MPEYLRSIASRALDNERSVWVRTPRAPTKRLTVFLDGEMYRDKVGATSILERFDADEAAPPSWWVFVSSHSPEARWRECPCHPPFVTFFADEFMPWLAREFPETASTDHLSLVGLSYTGLAAAYIALQRPELVQNVVSQSGSFWWNDGWLLGHVPMRRGRAPRFRLEVGRRETQTNLQHRADVFQRVSQLEGVRRFRDALGAAGYEAACVEGEGAQDAAAWAEGLPQALRWCLGTPLPSP